MNPVYDLEGAFQNLQAQIDDVREIVCDTRQKCFINTEKTEKRLERRIYRLECVVSSLNKRVNIEKI